MITSTGAWTITGQQFQNEHAFDPRLAEQLCSILEEKQVQTVYDFGCGHGMYTKLLNERGFKCQGFDGNPITSQFPGCSVQDLTDPQFRKDPVDCVVCLEVAEHVPKEYETALVDAIDRHVKSRGFLVLSWAVPGQGGFGHVNCQTNEYAIQKFTDRGYLFMPYQSQILRMNCVYGWFQNTVMVFQKA